MRAASALIRYLADMRFKLSRWLNAENNTVSDTTIESRLLFSPSIEAQDPRIQNFPDLGLEKAAELVDTTLFRTYIFCRPQLVGPLVRRPNRCIPSVVQEMLEHTHVYSNEYSSDDRNIEILPNFYWERDFIDRHYNFYTLWVRKRIQIWIQFQLLHPTCKRTCRVQNILFYTFKS